MFITANIFDALADLRLFGCDALRNGRYNEMNLTVNVLLTDASINVNN